MTRWSLSFPRRLLSVALCAFPVIGLLIIGAPSARAQSEHPAEPQTEHYERTYRQSKSAVERALKELQSSMGGRLPVLDGFAVQGDRPLNRFQRAYYQSTVQVSSTAAGGSVVRLTAKVTAWYADSIPSHSGYEVLISDGRIESALLDQLGDLLATRPGATRAAGNSAGNSSEPFPVMPSAAAKNGAFADKKIADDNAAETALSAPVPQSGSNSGFSSLN